MTTTAEVVKTEKCPNHVNLNCDVKEVRVTPCPETEQNKPCLVKRGKRVKIEFDYTTNGNYSDLETRAYWASATGDLPWIGMDTNGCAHTECPTQNEKSEKFLYDLKIGNKFPVRQYDVKWRLWKEDSMECCFIIKIKLVK
ncbi:Epididymal secretory protein E1 precursor, putative [Pediculus humanus corporis]|uniref:Epididymal secretory protein E1, putative n=1 Tax=Pediculus humanus subsp. corporis TaxID=121224 RepID=E0VLE3_PEDHC|nr:Epididymal secretory protein E1 precursor, putative [Pediculus humanus corporis]EEB14199.1 Epididymal secretory protein E1 precursor, putative [Pediculus humanus corporis]